jgi:hypothetical protein
MENSESFIESTENNQVIVNTPIINQINVSQLIQEIEPIHDILMESLNDSLDSLSSNSIEAPPTEQLTESPTEPPTEPPTDQPTEPPTDQPTEPPIEPPTELSFDDKEKELIEILRNNEYTYDIPTNREIIVLKLYDLFKNFLIDENCDDSDYLTYLGFYCGVFKFDVKKQNYYYKKAVEGGNVHAMFNLGLYYQNIDKYNISRKYFKMAVRKGDKESMLAYGNHILYEDRDVKRAKKYYNLAKNSNYYRGYYELAYYYCEFKFNYKKFKEYVMLFLDSFDKDEEKYNDVTKMRKMTLIKLIGVIFTYEFESNINYLIPYCTKFNLDDSTHKLEKYNDKMNLRKQYMLNKKKFNITKECGICYEEKELYIFDCLEHYTCLDCYSQINKCAFCSIEKHQLMKIKPINDIPEEDDIDIIDDTISEDSEINNESESTSEIVEEEADANEDDEENADEDADEEDDEETDDEADDEDDEDEDDDDEAADENDYDEDDLVDIDELNDVDDIDEVFFVDDEIEEE